MHLHSYELFSDRLQETFTAVVGDFSVDMTLIDAKRLPDKFASPTRAEPFRLHFKCAGEVLPAQGTYTFVNAATGEVEMFVVPIGREKDGMIYEALFN
jgi:hypothetical protein